MLINSTPLRTSKNFGMNEIELKDFKISNHVGIFDGLAITGETSKFEISSNSSKEPLKYGNGKELENQVLQNANKNIKIEDKKSGMIQLDFNFNEKNKELVENINIVANTKSKTTILIKYSSTTKNECYHNGIVRVKANKDSKSNIVIVNLLNNSSNNFLSIENEIEENASVTYTIVDFGGKTSITNYFSNVKGNDSKSNLNTIYLGKENQMIDINYIAEIRGERAKANIEVQGALKDMAIKNFKGTIDFKKGCKKAKGDENEFCMLLSDTAKSKALPMLLCTEEDVEGSHSTAAGKAEENMLFYIMSRGVSKKDAMKLIVKAKFNKIIETIKDENIKEIILNEIDERLE